MNVPSLLQAGLWIIPVVLQLFIAAAMIRKRLVCPFSLFFVFLLYAAARDIVLFLLHHQPASYFWFYWTGEGLSLILQLLFLGQIVRYLLLPHPELRRHGNSIFIFFLIVCGCFAVAVFYASVLQAGPRVIEFILLAGRAARILQVSLLVVTLACLSRIGLTANHHATGILLGSGVAGLQLIPFELRASLHAISDAAFVWLAPAIYDCAVLVWAAWLLRSRPPAFHMPVVDRDLSRWDQTLKQYLARL